MPHIIESSPSSLAPDTRGPFETDSRGLFRVTQISTTDERGGAARAAQRLHHGLARLGLRSQMLVAQRFGGDTDTTEYNPLSPGPRILGHALFRLGRRWHRPSIAKAGAYFTPEWNYYGWRLPGQVPACDLLNLHFVADLLDYRTLPRLTASRPVVWTLHDMNAFTGGCHYSGTCARYTDCCGSCPQLVTSSGESDMTRRIMLRKRAIFARVSPHRLTIVCPSRWLADEARRSSLFGRFDVRVIPNGVDTHDYRPVERAEARRRLGLPPGARVVLFVADQIDDQRKGLRQLLAALAAIRDISGLLLVTLGRGDHGSLPHSHTRHLGVLQDAERLRTAYSAADVFAIPSLQDNLPNTVLEALACGTPVAGFDTGGVREAVKDGVTGLLARTGDSAALADALRRILVDRALQQSLSAAARDQAEREFPIRLQAQRYAALYRQILNENERIQTSPP
jgi:glycosyltransferase involved in cell wall biosynthesis